MSRLGEYPGLYIKFLKGLRIARGWYHHTQNLVECFFFFGIYAFSVFLKFAAEIRLKVLMFLTFATF